MFPKVSLVLLMFLMSLVEADLAAGSITRVLPIRGGIPKFPLLGTFRDPYMGGFYYTTIKLGTPPRKFHVQIDTGSSDLWVNCKPCPDCPGKSKLGFKPNLFIREKSSTAREMECFDKCTTLGGQCTNETKLCQFSREYGGGRGVFGYYVTDLMEMDVVLPGDTHLAVKNTSVEVVFGCSTHLSGGFTHANESVDGILGLSKIYLSPVLQITSKLMIPSIFSHCLGDDGNGTLVLGEFDYHTTIVYSPLLPATLYVGGKQLGINPTVFNTSEVKVDSGTSMAFLVAEAYDVFIDAINVAVAKYAAPVQFEGTICYKMSISHIDRFPLLSFNFGGNTSMDLNPKDYILRHRPIIDGVPALCIGIQKSMVDNFTILGALVLKDKIIVYDIERKRLGWSDYYNCSKVIGEESKSNGVAIIRNLKIYILYMILIVLVVI